MRKILALLTALCLLAGMIPAASAAEIYDASQMGGFRRTKEQVAVKYNEAIAAGGGYLDYDSGTWYSRAPSLSAPYDQGVLRQDTLDAMIAMTNYLRWLSGVEPLQQGAVNSDAMQRGALIRNYDFNHNVSDSNRPGDMDPEFWDSGKVWHNIIAMGYHPRGSIVGWCNEGYNLNSGSWDTVGHRYCLIASDISAVEFGYAGRVAIGQYTASENRMQNPFAAFPAPGPVPTELFTVYECVWSAEPNPEVFRVDDPEALSVTVTDGSTGSSYVCTKENGKLRYDTWAGEIDFVQPEPAEYLDGYYYPDGTSYEVRISGLTEKAGGKSAEIRYQVDFFSMKDMMSTPVTSCATAFGTTLFLPGDLRDEASLKTITAALPAEVIAETQNGRSVGVPVAGGWTFDSDQQCWTGRADATALPENISDPSGMLDALRIERSDTYDYTGYLYLGGDGQAVPGKPGSINVRRYMLGTPTIRVYQLKKDGTVVTRYTEASECCTDDGTVASFAVDAWSPEYDGTWVAIYGIDWLGGFVAGILEIDLACSHARTRTVRTEPTCTQAGSEDVICDICGEQLSHTSIDAPGHDYQTQVTAPTCTAQGYTTHTCSRCGDSYEDGYVPALGHSFGSWTQTEAPTCDAAGTETRTCTRCAQEETRGVDALGHDYQAEVTPPGCTEQGFTTHTCSRCGDVRTDTYVAALGHLWDEGRTVREPGEAQPGLRRYTCKRCGETRDEIIPSADHVHDYTAEVTAPSCTAQGFTTYTCAKCGDSYVDSFTAALGHDLEDHDARAPTCTDAGWAAYQTCRRCDYTTYEEIGAFGHDYRDGICTRCGRADPDPPVPENPFIDVAEGTFYFDAVLWAVSTDPQVTSGTSRNTFSPGATCTRAQVVTFLWRAKGCPEPEMGAGDSPFTDVHEGNYYFKAVSWAVENGITNGTSGTTFSPDQGCTRGQVVTFLHRFAGTPVPGSSANPFRDVRNGAFYYDAVLWAVEKGVTRGTGAASFSPDATCTRGQIVTFLYRAMK